MAYEEGQEGQERLISEEHFENNVDGDHLDQTEEASNIDLLMEGLNDRNEEARDSLMSEGGRQAIEKKKKKLKKNPFLIYGPAIENFFNL